VKWKRAVENKVDELRCIKDHFAKFVPETVKRLVIANPQAPDLDLHEYDVSVLFVDISGYTNPSEQLPPNTLNRLVERYFSAFLDDI
jgi:class 3 adenylate cyclase